MFDGPKSVWRYIECKRCATRFHPNRTTSREWHDSKRCPSCGEQHTGFDIQKVDLGRNKDSKGVYMIYNAEEEVVKIGISKDVDDRISQMQTANAAELEKIAFWDVKHAAKAEEMIHNRLFDDKVNGEWFSVEDTDIYSLKNAIDLFLSDGSNMGGKQTA